MDPARIRLAPKSPAYCAACFSPHPGERHIDFGAAYDGPMVPSLVNVAGLTAQSIDELIVCETCVKRAAALLGLGDVEAAEQGLDDARAATDVLHEQIAAYKDHIAQLEQVRASDERLASLLPRPKRKATA